MSGTDRVRNARRGCGSKRQWMLPRLRRQVDGEGRRLRLWLQQLPVTPWQPQQSRRRAIGPVERAQQRCAKCQTTCGRGQSRPLHGFAGTASCAHRPRIRQKHFTGPRHDRSADGAATAIPWNPVGARLARVLRDQQRRAKRQAEKSNRPVGSGQPVQQTAAAAQGCRGRLARAETTRQTVTSTMVGRSHSVMTGDKPKHHRR